MENPSASSPKIVRGRWIGVGLVLGAATGLALNNLAVGLAAGLIIGSLADLYRGFKRE